MFTANGRGLMLAVLAVAVLALPHDSMAAKYEEVFSDNFDSYALGTLVSSGNIDGWIIPSGKVGDPFWGSGVQDQKIVDTYTVSPSNSLQLQGRDNWASNAYRSVDIPTIVRLEGKIRIDGDSDCSVKPNMTHILALMGLYNPDVGLWGQGYGEIDFNCDNKIYAKKTYSEDESKTEFVELMSYNRDTWYSVILEVNQQAGIFTVIIDGNVVRRDIEIKTDSQYQPTGIRLGAIHGGDQSAYPTGYPLVWFDDIRISGYNPNPWPMFVVPATQKE